MERHRGVYPVSYLGASPARLRGRTGALGRPNQEPDVRHGLRGSVYGMVERVVSTIGAEGVKGGYFDGPTVTCSARAAQPVSEPVRC